MLKRLSQGYKTSKKRIKENFETKWYGGSKEKISYLSKKVSEASSWRVFLQDLDIWAEFWKAKIVGMESSLGAEKNMSKTPGVHGTAQWVWAGVLGCVDR